MKMKSYRISKETLLIGSLSCIFLAALYTIYDNSTWHQTEGKITFVKQIDTNHYLYALEFDSTQGPMKVYNHDVKEPYLRQNVSLAFKKQGELKVKILYPLKYKHHT
ncbi:MAG: hypothetical protein Q8K36_03250 [Alphaproteobacteria bacterium]|nr:hypothetical protein [Alphaproteobacteria bacterium]